MKKLIIILIGALVALPISPFVIAAVIYVSAIFNAESADGGARHKTPCQIYRDNLYNAGVPPGQVIDMVAYCISNREHRRTVILTDPEEIKQFRSQTYIAPPRLVEKNQRGEIHE